MNRQLKSFLITTGLYIILTLVFIFVRFKIPHIEEHIISFSLMEEGMLGKVKNESGKEVLGGIGIMGGEVPIVSAEQKPELLPFKKPEPPLSVKLGSKGNKSYSILGEISKRRLIKFVKPKYPEGVQGEATVSLKITVDRDGNVVKLNVIKTGEARFDKNAIEAVKEWKFQPLPPNVNKLEEGIVNIYFLLK